MRPSIDRIGETRDQAQRTDPHPTGARCGVRIRRGLRERDALGPRGRDLGTDRRRAGRGRGALPTRPSTSVAGSLRWSTGSPPSSRRTVSCSSARARGSRRSTRSALRRTGTGTRIDYVADIRLGGALRLVQPFLGRAFTKLGHEALAGMQRTLDARAPHGGRAAPDGSDMKVAIVGAGVSGLTAAYALRHDHEVRLFEGDTPPSAATSRPSPSRRTAGRSPSTPASSSTTSTPTHASPASSPSSSVETQPSDMSLGSACHACGVEFSSRGLPGLLRPPRRSRSARLTGG